MSGWQDDCARCKHTTICVGRYYFIAMLLWYLLPRRSNNIIIHTSTFRSVDQFDLTKFQSKKTIICEPIQQLLWYFRYYYRALSTHLEARTFFIYTTLTSADNQLFFTTNDFEIFNTMFIFLFYQFVEKVCKKFEILNIRSFNKKKSNTIYYTKKNFNS